MNQYGIGTSLLVRIVHLNAYHVSYCSRYKFIVAHQFVGVSGGAIAVVYETR